MSTKPRPLSSGYAARSTLVQRLAPRGDRLRQRLTRFGLRPRRVFLVWIVWDGEVRGEGFERELARVELLPTPRVTDLTALTRRAWPQGIMAEGSVRVDQISMAAYDEDVLRGLVIPRKDLPPRNGTPVGGTAIEPRPATNCSFWYELVEDRRGEDAPRRQRMRLHGMPWRYAGGLYFAVNLEASESATNRAGDLPADDLDVVDS